MEKHIYLYSSNESFSAARKISVRDDGTYSTEVASYPPSDSDSRLTFIGTSGNIAGFLDRKASSFILWDVQTSTEVRRVRYDPQDAFLPASSCCLGPTDQQYIKIVGVGRVGMTCRVKTHSSGPNAGAVVGGGMVGADNQFQGEDQTWTPWVAMEGHPTFLPDKHQPARLIGDCIYWYGNEGRRKQIVTYNLNTDVIGNLLPPVQHKAVALGYDSMASLTATLYERGSITIWAWFNNIWNQLMTMQFASTLPSPPLYPYVPICFFPPRFPGMRAEVFLVDEDCVTLLRSVEDRDGNWAIEAEDIHRSPVPIVASLLPTTLYQVS